MDEPSQSHRLSQIQTLWSMVSHARDGVTPESRAAQQQLLERYRRVVGRYLLGALRDADAADELAQEFALRFVRGDLGGADRSRGRFRDYLKGVLFHLIGDYHRRARRQPLPLADGHDPAGSAVSGSESDVAFTESWKSELLAGAWRELAKLESETGQPFHTVLAFRAAHPEMRSEQMALELSARSSRPLTAAGVRQTLHRAREKFASLLIDEIAQTLVDPTLGELEQELIDLGLIDYCRPALERLSGGAGASQ